MQKKKYTVSKNFGSHTYEYVLDSKTKKNFQKYKFNFRVYSGKFP